MKRPHPTTRKRTAKGFTLLEIGIAVSIILIVVAIAVAALGSSKSDSAETGASANAKTLNDAITRAKLAGETDPRIVGPDANDVEAAVEFLSEKGYIK